MKRIIAGVFTLLALFSTSTVFAGPDHPSLKGVWTVKSEGGIILWGEKPGKTTHWEEKQTSLTAELDIVAQNGRVLSGVFKSDKATERFIGVIGHDNVSLHFADADGAFDGKIIDSDTIEVLYRHVTPKDTVVAVGLWRRKK
ncbi:MAG: hypothetical protein LM550_13265 [Candidatus Contendobacter sp.]|jgi:hypothetical protein|nr:hypothetical protein [Gammaproteobacteria bacterium]MCC8994626.1 hypothetical protein [Candidatus Contendobacter sp.]